VSIIRVGLAETKKFGDGYEAIFGKGKKTGKPAKVARAAKKTAKKKAKKK
jgi:hypothetical protein